MSQNKQLKEVLNNLEQTIELANLDLSTWDFRTRPGMEGKKSVAKYELPAKKMEYARALADVSTKVFLVGNTANASTLANYFSHHVSLVVNFNALYETLAEQVKHNLSSNKMFSSSAYIRLVAELTHLSRLLNVDSINPPKELEQVSCDTFEELVEVVKNTTIQAFGDKLNIAYINDQFVTKCLETKYSKDSLIVVFHNMTEQEAHRFNSQFLERQSYHIVNASGLLEGSPEQFVNKLSTLILTNRQEQLELQKQANEAKLVAELASEQEEVTQATAPTEEVKQPKQRKTRKGQSNE